MNERLFTKAELRNLMMCEVCGVTAPKRPWPAGWSGCGRSRRFLYSDATDPSILAHWCPLHQHSNRYEANPTVGELRKLRAQVLEAEHVAAQPEPEIVQEPAEQAEPEQPTIKWSARREGLVPMRIRNEPEDIRRSQLAS